MVALLKLLKRACIMATGLTLRWNQLNKAIQVKQSNAGLYSGSIAAPVATDLKEFKLGGPITKTIFY
jgi:hypothetical protein